MTHRIGAWFFCKKNMWICNVSFIFQQNVFGHSFLSTRAPPPMRAWDTWMCNSVLCPQHPNTQVVFDEWMNEYNITRAPSWPEALGKLLPKPSFYLLLLLTSSHAIGAPGSHSAPQACAFAPVFSCACLSPHFHLVPLHRAFLTLLGLAPAPTPAISHPPCRQYCAFLGK